MSAPHDADDRPAPVGTYGPDGADGADGSDGSERGARPAPRRVLVVGSYPPVGTPGAAATLAIVRDLWRQGADPIVSSPRTSAAPLAVPVIGPLAGRRLTQLAGATGARELVLCAERGYPVPVTVRPAAALGRWQHLTVRSLCRAVTGFDHVTIVACGDTGVAAQVWAPLHAQVDVVVEQPAGVSSAGVTVLGPDHASLGDAATNAVRRLARRGLGPAYGPARAIAARAYRRAQALRAM